jgi:hypothetical protein
MDLTDLRWRQSRRSAGTGGNCVEVAAVWRKSRRSAGNGGACVEVAGLADAIAVRDSKNPDGPKLTFATPDWRALTRDIKIGHYDL